MMRVSRRQFLKYCGSAAAALGLTTTEIGILGRAVANPTGPAVVWLQGSGCLGCSISFLNRISTDSPTTAASLLIDSINLTYHPALMGSAGESASASARATYDQGNYILVVEGGVPTAYGGHACGAWTIDGVEFTLEKVVREFATKASQVVCVGTCAAWGGIPAAPPNPTNVTGVKALTGRNTINVAGCPPHPDWIVWVVAQLLMGKAVDLDQDGRPTALYGRSIHGACPRRGSATATTLGSDGLCLARIGCRGPRAKAPCPSSLFNGGRNWCIGANAPCIGCTESGFPGPDRFFRQDYL